MRFDAFEFARGEVGDEANLLADEVFGFVVFCYAGDDCAGAHAVVDEEAQEFVGFWDGLAFEHFADADVDFEECVEVDGSGLWLGLPCL